MELLLVILSIVIIGGLIGALGRLAIPGPNPMSIGMTILVGIGGALLGSFVGVKLLGATGITVFILEVLGAALIVWLLQRRGAANRI